VCNHTKTTPPLDNYQIRITCASAHCEDEFKHETSILLFPTYSHCHIHDNALVVVRELRTASAVPGTPVAMTTSMVMLLLRVLASTEDACVINRNHTPAYKAMYRGTKMSTTYGTTNPCTTPSPHMAPNARSTMETNCHPTTRIQGTHASNGHPACYTIMYPAHCLQARVKANPTSVICSP